MAEEKIIKITVQSEQALNRIVELTNSLNKNSKAVQDLNKDYADQKISVDAYTKSLSILKAQEKAHKDELRTLGNEIKNVIKQETEQLGYIQKLEAEVSNLTLKYKQLSESELKGAKGKEVTELLTKKRAELQDLNQQYGNYTMNVGNYSSATKMMAINMAQVLREAPNFAISARIGIMSLTNNLPMLAENIKQVAAEQKILNQQFKAGLIDTKPEGTVKMLVKSMIGLNGIMAAAMLLIQVFGPQLIDWVGSLFKTKDATDKLTESQLGLKSSMEISREAMKNGGEYKEAVANIEKLSVTLKAAKGNTDLEKAAVDEYNKTLGVTFGKVSDVDSALKKINENEKAYIEAMKNMSFANAFFAQSAEDATKAMEVGLKTNAELVGEESEKYITLIKEASEDRKKVQAGENVWIEELQNGFWVKTRLTLDEALKKENDLRNQYNRLASAEREKQILAIQKHQNKTLEEATKYYEKYAKAFKDNNWVVAEDEKKKRKETFDYETKLREAQAKAVNDDMVREMQVVISNEQKKQDELKTAYDKKLVTQAEYTELSIAYEEQRKRELSDITDKYIKKETDKISKLFEEEKKNRDKRTQDALDANRKELEAKTQTARDILKTAELNNNETLSQKLNLLKAERELEVTAAYEKGESVKAVNDYYDALEAKTKRDTLWQKQQDTLKYFDAIGGIAKSANDFASSLGDRELSNFEKNNKGKIGFEVDFAKKKAEVARKNAIFSRSVSSFETIVNTAATIMKTGAELGYPLAIPFQIAAGAEGGLQLATIWAAPLPEYNASSQGQSGAEATKTTVTEKFHTGTYQPATKSQEQEITRTLLTTERILSPQQTVLFDSIVNNVQSLGGADNVIGGVGMNSVSQFDTMAAAFSLALTKMPNPVLDYSQWKKFEAKQIQFEQNRTL